MGIPFFRYLNSYLIYQAYDLFNVLQGKYFNAKNHLPTHILCVTPSHRKKGRLKKIANCYALSRVIRCLTRNGHIVWMTLVHAGIGNLCKLGMMQVFYGSGSTVAHSGT